MRTDIRTIDIGTPPPTARRRSSQVPTARRIVGWPLIVITVVAVALAVGSVRGGEAASFAAAFVGIAVILVARATRTGARGMLAAMNASASGESAAMTPTVESPSTTGYVCPMHTDRIHSAPGVCPLCGMGLAPRTVSAQDTRR